MERPIAVSETGPGGWAAPRPPDRVLPAVRPRVVQGQTHAALSAPTILARPRPGARGELVSPRPRHFPDVLGHVRTLSDSVRDGQFKLMTGAVVQSQLLTRSAHFPGISGVE